MRPRSRRRRCRTAAAVGAVTLHRFAQLGEEFMPPLDEGDLLYMPTADPGPSIIKARELPQQTDKLSPLTGPRGLRL